MWKAPYQVRYTHCHEERERQRRTDASDDWRVLYFRRRQIDREALLLLDIVRGSRIGRHDLARRIVREYGFDVWDALREESRLSLPAWCCELPPQDIVQSPPDALPRRYWSQVMLGVIARHSVITLWAKVARPNQQEVNFEEALAGLSAFFDVSTKEASRSTYVARRPAERRACRCLMNLTSYVADASKI